MEAVARPRDFDHFDQDRIRSTIVVNKYDDRSGLQVQLKP